MNNCVYCIKCPNCEDTERLDWMMENKAQTAMKPNGKWVCEIIRMRGYRSFGDYETPREAIDAAMKASK